jgi:phosphatidate cytidylyltransferase
MSEELRLRIIAGVILAAIVLMATWHGGMAFRLLAAAIGLLIHYEWMTVTRIAAEDKAGNTVGWLAQAMVAANVLFGSVATSFSLLAAFFIVLLARAILRRTSYWLPFGVVYAGLSSVSLAAFRGEDANGLLAMLFIFAVVWGTDILAYFVGRALGGPKLAPKISPGKTWSGAIGGAISGIVAGAALVLATGHDISVWLLSLAFLLSVASQVGDLFESFVKRRFGVKDSSHLIPGHGGVMDRVDGLVFASFAAFLTCSAIIYAEGRVLEGYALLLLGI